jgi:DNA-directed RNA polymerase specialized sigma24 family protein
MHPQSTLPLDLQRYRTYLLLLARSHDKMGGEEASDLVQKTMLAAHAQRAEFRGQSPAELAAWLKQILRREVIDAYRHGRRQCRDVRREIPLEARWMAPSRGCSASQQFRPAPANRYRERKNWSRWRTPSPNSPRLSGKQWSCIICKGPP